MRVINSMKNVSIGIIAQIIITVLGFISRRVFLDSLGTEYLGINGLLTNVLSLLALVESGIGASIIYSLYKPLAMNDHAKTIALIQLYKKAYTFIAIITLILSLILWPFLEVLMKDGWSNSYIPIAYFIFVAKNMVSYLNAHKVSLIQADQKGYVLASINFGFQIITTVTKIIVLILTEDYILYLSLELGLYLTQNLLIGKAIDKRYSYINTKEKYPIDRSEKEILVKNIKALFLHNLGTYFVFGTDNILISSFVGIATVGLYSNYTMIIGQIGSLLSPILGGVGASVGNLIALESNEKSYSVFKVTYLINFWLYSVCVVCLVNLLQPFIHWWLGEGYLLDRLTFLIIVVNFYITGLRASILTFKAKAGIFVHDRYMPLIEGLINLGASLVLVKYLGLAGIFLGTTISTLSTVFWNAPRLVYKNLFKVSLYYYFIKYIIYAALTLIACFLTMYICNGIKAENTFIILVAKGIICLLVPNTMYILIFYKNPEFQYLLNMVKNAFVGLKVRLTSSG